MARASKPLVWGLVAVVALVAIGLYRHYDLGHLLTLDTLKASRDALASAFQQRPLTTVAVYFGVYVLATALSIPGATILTLAGGAMFGLGRGLLIVSFASSVGALLAFLATRYLLHDAVQTRFGRQLEPINEGMRRDGVLYLLTLRLVPVFPFFLVNLLMALTPIAALRFYWASQLGMLAGTAVYVNAGTQLAAIQKPGDVLSAGLLASFALLGIFPLIAKGVAAMLKRRKVYQGWPRPQQFDRNLLVIGAGAGGLVTAYIAAAVKARVTLVESGLMGGDCLNYGCVPSKALIRSAKLAHQLGKADTFGIRNAHGVVDFAAVMARVQRVVGEIAPHDSVERYRELGVDVVKGYARIVSPWAVEITTTDGAKQTLTTRNIVIATGAAPFIPDLPGLDQVGYYTSDTIWTISARPQRLVVLGGGPIGCELAQAFARLGCKVTQIVRSDGLMRHEDPDAAELVTQSLRADGVTALTHCKALRCEQLDGIKRLIVRQNEIETTLEFDALLCAVGRQARVEGFGLDTLGIALTARNTIEVDPWLRTRFSNIYAVGDVVGPYQFTHAASHQAWFAAVNALFGRFKRYKVDYSVLPWTTFTDPEVARVGLSETEARAQKIDHEITRYDLGELDRAIADGSARGFVKVLTVPGKDKILGVTIVGEHAGDLLAEYVLAMKHGLGLNKILGTIHTYPTLAEANKAAAGAWKRAHAPKKLLAWVERFHTWERT